MGPYHEGTIKMDFKHKATCLAAVLATLSGAVMAQSSATIYGRGNVSLENQKVGTVSEDVFVDNSSRVGVRATRGMDAGMSAGFSLEAATNLTTGSTNSSLFAREASMFFAGNFGKVKLGKMPGSAAYFATADYVSNHNHDTGTSSDALWDFPSAFQLSRAVAYTSPDMGGLTLEAQYGMKTGTASGETQSVKVNPVSMAANYAIGGLKLALGYETGANSFTTADDSDSMNATTLRAYYVMGPLGFGGYVQKTTGVMADRTAYRLSGMYTMGKHEYHVNFGGAGNRDSVSDTGAKQYTLAYNYNVDSQFKLYALFTTIEQDSATAYYQGNASRFIAGSTGNGNKLSSFGVGTRYNF